VCPARGCSFPLCFVGLVLWTWCSFLSFLLACSSGVSISFRGVFSSFVSDDRICGCIFLFVGRVHAAYFSLVGSGVVGFSSLFVGGPGVPNVVSTVLQLLPPIYFKEG